MAVFSASPLSRLPHLSHGFFTRAGGVSEGRFASLNCGFGSGDDPRRVEKNRALAADALEVAPSRLLTCFQTHSAEVVDAAAPWAWPEAPKADAMVTATGGLALGILTADCAPVLLADVERRVIGAAHAGWKGALAGVLEATVEKMRALGARSIVAAIGPCIAQESYEVGAEFYERFLAADGANAAYFLPSDRAAHWRFDLPGYAAGRLKNAGVSEVNSLAIDTYLEEDACFSFRRATHRGEPQYGRLLSAIALK